MAEVVREAMDTSQVREQLHDQGGELVLGTPAAFAAVIAADSRQWTRVVRDAGITLDP